MATGDVAGGRYVSNLTDLAVFASPAQPGAGGGRSTSIAVQGAVNTPISFTLPSLQALTAYTETVTYLSGTTTVTDTYTGALLWDVLNTAGVRTDPSIKNDILRKLVTATGTDGYQVDFALGELSPSFGNNPILVAYSDTAGTLATDGIARLVVPGDVAGGRYVSNLYSLTVFDGTSVPEPASLALLAAAVAALCIGRRCASPLAPPYAPGALVLRRRASCWASGRTVIDRRAEIERVHCGLSADRVGGLPVGRSFHELQQRRECKANRRLRALSSSREWIGEVAVRDDHVQVVVEAHHLVAAGKDRLRHRIVGAVCAVSLATVLERGGTMTDASEWWAATGPST